MSDDLRDAIAYRMSTMTMNLSPRHDNVIWGHLSPTSCEVMADAVLALPEIVDMLALKLVVNGLTVEQVARALQCARIRLEDMDGHWHLTDDEKAIAAWVQVTP